MKHFDRCSHVSCNIPQVSSASFIRPPTLPLETTFSSLEGVRDEDECFDCFQVRERSENHVYNVINVSCENSIYQNYKRLCQNALYNHYDL